MAESPDTAPDAELDRIAAARDRGAMAPTIAALLDMQQRYPGHARVLYELAGAYDTAGEEATAAGFYEQALSAGLSGDVLRRCYLQYGSTLRNLGRTAESLAVFAEARRSYPGSASLRVFEALSLHADGRVDAALGTLLLLLGEDPDGTELERYRAAIRGNAEYLLSLDDERANE